MKRATEKFYERIFPKQQSLSILSNLSINSYKPDLSRVPDFQTKARSGASFHNLIGFLQEAVRTSASLALEEKPFDGMIIGRSALESLSYIMKICISDNPEETANEFFTDYFEALLAQETSKITTMHEVIANLWVRPLLDLGEDAKQVPSYFKEAQEDNPRRKRKPIMQDWSCGQILADIKKGPHYSSESEGLIIFYNHLSHLAHADPCGLKLKYWTKGNDAENDNYVKLNNIFYVISLSSAISRLCCSILKTLTGDLPIGRLLPNTKPDKELFLIGSGLHLFRTMDRQQVNKRMTKDEFEKKMLSLADDIMKKRSERD